MKDMSMQSRVSVVITGSVASASAVRHRLESENCRVTELDVASTTDLPALVDQIGQAFAIPYPVGGLDGLVGWLADLDWFEPIGGHVVVIHGLDDATAPVRTALADIAPFVLDRWRGANPDRPYVVVLMTSAKASEVLARVRASNDELDAIGHSDTVTRTAAVPVEA